LSSIELSKELLNAYSDAGNEVAWLENYARFVNEDDVSVYLGLLGSHPPPSSTTSNILNTLTNKHLHKLTKQQLYPLVSSVQSEEIKVGVVKEWYFFKERMYCSNYA
jgi:hypothetical protein